MADTRDLLVRIKGDTGDFEKSMKNVKSGSDDGHASFLKLTGAVAAGQAIFEGVAFAAHKAVDIISSSVKAYEDVDKANALLPPAVIDVSHATQDQLKQTNALADSLERKGVLDGDNIKMGLAQLSTFGLSNKAVQALGGSLSDLAVNQFGVNASGEQLSDSANMIAKALNGQFGVLEKSGIRFTDAQKHMIQYGTEMQKVDAINQGFQQNLKFTNDTALTTTEGKMAKLHVSLQNVQEAFGGVIVSAITPFIQKLSDFVSSDKFQAWLAMVTPIIQKDLNEAMQFLTTKVLPVAISAFKTLVKVGKDIIDFYMQHKTLVKAVVEIILALVIAFKAIEIVMNAVKTVTMIWNALALLNPWVLAIGLIIAAILLLVTHWTLVKQWISDFWGWIKGVFADIVDFIKAHWDLLLDILLGPIGFVIGELIKHWSTIKNGFTDVVNWIKNVFKSGFDWVAGIWGGLVGAFNGVMGGIKSALGSVWSVVTSPFKAAFNAVAGFWNDTMGKVDFHLPSWVPGVGGKGFSLPKIPMLAQGGIVDKATLAMIGEGSEPEAVIPLSKIPQMVQQVGGGGGQPVNITLNMNIGMYAGMPVEKREIALDLWKEIVRGARAQGVQLPMIGAVGVQ